jgi:hypothetical protein
MGQAIQKMLVDLGVDSTQVHLTSSIDHLAATDSR